MKVARKEMVGQSQKPKGRVKSGYEKTRHFIKDCYIKKGKQKEEANVVTSYDPSEVDGVYMLLDSSAKIVGKDCVSVVPF